MRRDKFVIALAALLAIISHAARADGDVANGEKIFARCKACHTIEQGKNKIGPSLYGIIGRHSGSLEGYNYSDAMKSSNLTWDEKTLDIYLTSPRDLVHGTRMAFPGLKKEQDRQDVIAYLKQATKPQ